MIAFDYYFDFPVTTSQPPATTHSIMASTSQAASESDETITPLQKNSERSTVLEPAGVVEDNTVHKLCHHPPKVVYGQIKI